MWRRGRHKVRDQVTWDKGRYKGSYKGQGKGQQDIVSGMGSWRCAWGGVRDERREWTKGQGKSRWSDKNGQGTVKRHSGELEETGHGCWKYKRKDLHVVGVAIDGNLQMVRVG